MSFEPPAGTGLIKNIAFEDLPVAGWITDTDPGAIGPGRFWIHPETGVCRLRNEDDDGWILIGRQSAAVDDSEATDVAGIVADFNGLLAALRTAGVLAEAE